MIASTCSIRAVIRIGAQRAGQPTDLFLNLPFLFLDGGIASVVEGDSQFGA